MIIEHHNGTIMEFSVIADHDSQNGEYVTLRCNYTRFRSEYPFGITMMWIDGNGVQLALQSVKFPDGPETDSDSRFIIEGVDAVW